MVGECEIAVAGGGPAGLTAALFAARHGRATTLLDPIGSGGAILNTAVDVCAAGVGELVRDDHVITARTP